jgi:long-chain acyl-CoA synthetase
MIKGYFKNAEKTRELFDEDGWINSGDVGLILPNGAIKLVDRAKNIFKLC